MKLYAQIGHQTGSKIESAARDEIIDGLIISPRYCSEAYTQKLAETGIQEGLDVLFDPQIYALPYRNYAEEKRNLGKLEDLNYFYEKWEKKKFIEGNQAVECIEQALQYQARLPLTHWISPNLVLEDFGSPFYKPFLDFIRSSIRVADKVTVFGNRPRILITISFSEQALRQKTELDNLLSEFSSWTDRPAGFYILLEKDHWDERFDCLPEDVIGNLLYLTYSLSYNGYEVVAGYVDMLTPFLIGVGASAGGTGWFEPQKCFHRNRLFLKTPPRMRGRPRYTSAPLLCRILTGELERFEEVGLRGIRSDTPYESEFPPRGSKVTVELEALQHWASIKSLINGIDDDVEANISLLKQRLKTARELYDRIEDIPGRLDVKSRPTHLRPLNNGIEGFIKSTGLHGDTD